MSSVEIRQDVYAEVRAAHGTANESSDTTTYGSTFRGAAFETEWRQWTRSDRGRTVSESVRIAPASICTKSAQIQTAGGRDRTLG